MQFFKGDEVEKKIDLITSPIQKDLSDQKNLFFNEAYECFVLGDIIWQSGRSPLSNAIPQNVFRETFFTLFNSFTFAGSFESYLEVFRRVFGATVSVVFTVPGPGKLNIDVVADSVSLDNFIARYIKSNQYFFDEVIDDEGDNIAFQSFKGLESEYEMNQMLFEMVPAGIYTQISLTILS